jgi:hypothetical protein
VPGDRAAAAANAQGPPMSGARRAPPAAPAVITGIQPEKRADPAQISVIITHPA